VKKNGQLINTSRINYQVFSNFNVQMPRTILVSKGAQPLEIKVTNMHNDTHGNPTEVRQENGIAISYLWGYNKSLPIAKIENATNSQIANALSMSSVNNLNETNFDTINNLRTLLPNALVTTIKHIPLVGVSEITDPKGDKVTYEYDNFNRLKTVKDKEGNLVSENQYHYRP
jgi:YD repeat-containing protein